MLDPERKQHIADGTEYISSLLHEEIVKIVSEAIVTRMERGVEYRLTARDRWMLELLQDAGYMREALEKEIADKTRLMLREVQAAFEDAAVESVAWDNDVYLAAGLEPLPLRQSPTLMRLAERGYEKTKGELVNFTGTLANTSQQLFIRECDKAYTLVASGAMSQARAVRQAVETAAGDGIVVRYPSGHRDTIETATGRAVRTGVGQACGDMTLARMDELDWDIVLVSSHLGARTGSGMDDWTNHYYLQSLGFFSRSGSDKRFKALSVCGIGYVDGLLGANCRHSIGPGDGVHNPYAHYDSEENRLREELEQRQRLLERRVRDTKRKVQGLKAAMDKAEDPADREELRGRYQQAARRLQQQNRDYNEFCEANELKPYRERLHIAGWDRKQAASATGAARAAEKAREAGDVPEAAVEATGNSGNGFTKEIRIAIIQGERVPNSITAATPQQKLQGYLLNSNHPRGKDKARVFNSVLGYHYENWDKLSDKFFDGLQTSIIAKVEETQYGIKYKVPMRIFGERGKSMVVNTVWQLDKGSAVTRLVTATFDKRTIRKEAENAGTV